MILHLHLKEKWYRMIERGEKTKNTAKSSPIGLGDYVILVVTAFAFFEIQINVDIIVSRNMIHS